MKTQPNLTTETVQSAALSLQGVNNVERCDGLTLGVFCVCDCIANDTLKEGLENTTGLFVDHCLDVLETVGTHEESGRGTYWLRYA